MTVGVSLPEGFQASAVHAGLQPDGALDLGLISDIVDDPQELTDRCVQDIRAVTDHNRFLPGLHRRHVLPSGDEMRSALERYYDGMARAISELRADDR